MIAKVQGNYVNFKQTSAENEKFVNSIVSESHPLFSKNHLKAAMFQKLTTRALSKELRIWKQIFPKELCFLNKIFQKNRSKGFRATLWSHEHSGDAGGFSVTHN